MAPLFPAILFGGPPHAGKSTLVYRASQALRGRAVPHYVLRASPDGEGGWSYETPPSLAAALRRRTKGPWTSELATALARDIAGRHLPLLVDAGGQVSPESELIAASCTHVVLLAAQSEQLPPWRALAERHGLVPVADLSSDLNGVSSIINAGQVMCGTIAGLATELSSDGPCFEALVERLAALCAYSSDELFRAHLALSEIDLVLHLERAIYPLPARVGDAWQPGDLAPLLATMPAGEPLAAYGVGPSWLYAALAAFNAPERFELFDARYGWVAPPLLRLGLASESSPLGAIVQPQNEGYTRVALAIQGSYLALPEAAGLTLPALEPAKGVVLDGKLPNWLWAGLARAYRDSAWLAIYRPRYNDAVVVRSGTGGPPVGQLIGPVETQL